jgi:putative toxin-antitoxin system antitoxin component (TIGR02293 family)
VMTVNIERVATILGGPRTLGSTITNLREFRLRVEAGLPVEALDSVVRHVATTHREAVEIKYRIVPRTTLARRRVLSLAESERVERLARIAALTEHVCGDLGRVYEFLRSDQPQIGGRPIDLVRSELGAREVEDLLMNARHPLPA